MGYPMTYPRAVMRNGLDGDYQSSGVQGAATAVQDAKRLIAGDLRRLEKDAQDALHIARYAKTAGISKGRAAAVLDAFFTDFGMALTPWLAKPCWPEKEQTDV